MTDSLPYADTWVVLPTYNEADNIRSISTAILEALPGATLLVVDDASPDGTGHIADELAAGESHIHVRHRKRKMGLGRAYVDGFAVVLAEGAQRIVQMDADWSHSPDYLPVLVGGLRTTDNPEGVDLVIGSRYVSGGGVRDWGLLRKLVSRGGSVFARTLLRLEAHDLTGGFKAWRREALSIIPWNSVHAGGYVFQIEATYLASRAGAGVTEVPIVFFDRRLGVSKMSKRIIGEALLVVLQLRWEELRGRGPRRILSPAGDADRREGAGADPSVETDSQAGSA
jgi:dolichol-phosphate mannosyltransferase